MPAKGATVSRLDLDAAHDGLRSVDGFAGIGRERLEPMAVKGLFHDHVRIVGTPWLLRLPRASQFELRPADNLDYQEACFAHASPSGCTPALGGRIEPRPRLPWGGLVVAVADGGPARLPDDLAAMARCLAGIHALPLPPEEERHPLAVHGRSDRRHSRLHRAPGALFRPRRDDALGARPDRRGARLGAGLRGAERRRAAAAHALRHRYPSRQFPGRARGRRGARGLRRPRKGALRLARHRRGACQPLHLDDVGRGLRRPRCRTTTCAASTPLGSTRFRPASRRSSGRG